MFCATCGKELPENAGNCPACGSFRQPAVVKTRTSVDVAAVAAETRGVLIIMLRDPVGGLPKAFDKLEKRRALEVGIAFAVVGALLVLIGVYMTIPPWARPANAFFGLLLLAVAMFGGLAGASFAARRLFHGTGSAEGDVFMATVSLAPVSGC